MMAGKDSLGLTINVDVDDKIDEVHQLFKCRGVYQTFWHSFVPPHRMSYLIGPLTETGVENWLKIFNDLGVKYTAKTGSWDKTKELKLDDLWKICS